MVKNAGLHGAWFAQLAVALAGAAAGQLLGTGLSGFGYRLPEERELSARSSGWIVPATALLSVMLWSPSDKPNQC